MDRSLPRATGGNSGHGRCLVQVFFFPSTRLPLPQRPGMTVY